MPASFAVEFVRVLDIIVVHDVSAQSKLTLVDVVGEKALVEIPNASLRFASDALGKIVYANSQDNHIHLYDVETNTDIDLGISGISKRIDERHFYVLVDDQILIVDIVTGETITMEYVSYYSRDPKYIHYTYALVGRIGNQYYIIG
ncbi:MAG: hypothetical protein MZU97_06050 [Bacillus subtilis]|nr:hypothetical protein [Bacillus subtilis]